MAKGYKKKKRGSARFVQLHHAYLDCQTRAGLSVGARAVLVELLRRYTGANNGRLYLPTREAAERLNIHRTTVSRYFSELESAGFIVATKAAALGLDGTGRATEWRLTHLPCDGRAPTRDFETKPLSHFAPDRSQKLTKG